MYYAKWVVVNAPVVVVSWIAGLWMFDGSLKCTMWGLVGIIAASLWYYWVHRAMHSMHQSNRFVNYVSWFHRANHHGEETVLPARVRSWRIMRFVLAILEYAYEIVVIGGALIALLPFIPKPMRVTSVMFALETVIMHHANCHNSRVCSLFHSAHHKDASSNFMPDFWDNMFGTLAEGPNHLCVIDSNYIWWIIAVVAIALKLGARRLNINLCR